MGDNRSKKEKKLAILDVLDKGITSPAKIALSTSLHPKTVSKYLGEIIRDRQGEITDKDMVDIRNDAFNTYKMLSYQAMCCLEVADSPEDKRKAIELWISVQRAEDDLMKKAGIYKEVKKLEITEEEIMNSKSGEQFISVVLDFLSMEGIDPMKFFIYQERRARGEFEPVVVMGEDLPDSSDPEDVYDQHRKDRARRRNMKRGDADHVMTKVNANNMDVRSVGASDIHIMKSLLINDTMTDSIERDFFDNADKVIVEEYMSFKQALIDSESEEEE